MPEWTVIAMANENKTFMLWANVNKDVSRWILVAKDSTKKEMIHTADLLLESFKRTSLSEQLNDIQTAVQGIEQNHYEGGCFENKSTIPCVIINLILERYGLRIEGMEF